jgi:uncharacterized protein (TIGR01777 family)
MRIVIPGGSGQVGRILTRHFQAQGHDVIVPGRNFQAAVFEGSDACINLAGRSVNCRYNEANRREILDSRVATTHRLNQTIATLQHPPHVWLNASTATIYRHALDRPMDEATGEFGGDEPGAPDTWNFSIAVAKAWEEAFFSMPTPGTRKVALRSAMTFSSDRGGVFDVFLNLVRHGLGGTSGSGAQFVSWIHEADFVRAIDLLIAREDFSGPVNLASPNPIPNREFMRVLREAWGTRIGLPASAWMLETGTWLMRTESELVLKSRRVVPGRLLAAGFEFEYPEWRGAARELVGRWRSVIFKR